MERLSPCWHPEWTKDPVQGRKAIAEQYPDEVNAKIIPWMMEHTKEEIYKLCRTTGYRGSGL